jgi:hypothetical protein
MGIARGLERRLERLVDGLAARLFRGRIHPVELGTLLVREADLAAFETVGGWGAPNRFNVQMGGEPVDPELLEKVEQELREFVEEAALDRGWRLEGPAEVTLTVNPSLRASEVEIEAEVLAGDRPVWARLRPLDPAASSIEITVNRAVIGRGGGSDAHVVSDEVSRTHAVLWQESGSAWVADLESSNGTFVNGERVVDPIAVMDGDLLAFGSTEYLIGSA